jgi:hypothetical protein
MWLCLEHPYLRIKIIVLVSPDHVLKFFMRNFNGVFKKGAFNFLNKVRRSQFKIFISLLDLKKTEFRRRSKY